MWLLERNVSDFLCAKLIKINLTCSFGRDLLIYSFHVCNDEEGGPQLNIDFTEYFSGGHQVPKILQSYKGVCKCINIPISIYYLRYWSINNHGNELMAYYENNCKETVAEPTFIMDGHSYDSRNMYYLRKSHNKVRSIGPAKNSSYYKTSCLQT